MLGTVKSYMKKMKTSKPIVLLILIAGIFQVNLSALIASRIDFTGGLAVHGVILPNNDAEPVIINRIELRDGEFHIRAFIEKNGEFHLKGKKEGKAKLYIKGVKHVGKKPIFIEDVVAVELDNEKRVELVLKY